MRGSDMRTGELFSYVDLEKRVPAHHPLRLIRRIVNEVLADLDGEFAELYAAEGRPSIAPERLLRALLLQAFYTIQARNVRDGAVAIQSALSLVGRYQDLFYGAGLILLLIYAPKGLAALGNIVPRRGKA